MRPTKNQTYMEIAETVAKRSHDAETQVGAVLVKNSTGAVIATGQNGFVRGAPDSKLPNTRPDKYKYIVHAEQNLLANCARHGISMDDCTLVCTLSPCVSCMRIMWQCGITRVIVKEKYKDFQEILQMKDLGIDVRRTEEGFTELRYSVETD